MAGTGAALTIVPRHVLGRGIQAPSDTVNIAVIGFGMGASNAQALMSQNIVAFCDVQDSRIDAAIERFRKAAAADPTNAQRGGGSARQRKVSAAQEKANARRPAMNSRDTAKRFVEQNLPKLAKYRDYREMLDKQKDLDGIVVATPDHMHAPIAAMAMDLGKHVYVQKPLCWSVEEARVLAKKAKDHPKVVTQMGNQGHSWDDARTGYEYIAAGTIGDVREVHVWTNRPLGYWPQGVPRPAPLVDDPNRPLGWSGRDVEKRLAAALTGNFPKPSDLDWNLFLGAAPEIEYHPIYHPFNWRGWVDWGQGALGDMGAHLVDHPFWALNLGFPSTVETLSTPFNGASYPHATTTYYEFPARGNMPAVKMTWYDGGLLPPKPAEVTEERMNPDGGLMYVGSNGKLIQDTYGGNPRLYMNGKQVTALAAPPQKLPRIAHEEHEMNWVETIKGHAEISSPFEYATRLTEVMLLGVVALRAGQKIQYDGANMRITNSVATRDQPLEGEQLLRREYRQGFGLPDTKTL